VLAVSVLGEEILFLALAYASKCTPFQHGGKEERVILTLLPLALLEARASCTS